MNDTLRPLVIGAVVIAFSPTEDQPYSLLILRLKPASSINIQFSEKLSLSPYSFAHSYLWSLISSRLLLAGHLDILLRLNLHTFVAKLWTVVASTSKSEKCVSRLFNIISNVIEASSATKDFMKSICFWLSKGLRPRFFKGSSVPWMLIYTVLFHFFSTDTPFEGLLRAFWSQHMQSILPQLYRARISP
ncbi:predicted protein [Clavispora lusitaniae ATCC 42720]|uniref:Uncharacterized protein n=1 Tax=Clavispora lusitaniae (strain ATCC 42720) TaxID=306902 RepID=C4Y4T9_CLAL4|nr:uncharacterized protein CLUG_04077 [Clavispora lusitaniae ATCC 42720]EEQ39950.1 predicted protein [Clavispora lusitaniae ATCC 42720]